MDKESLKYYKTIGMVQQAITKVSTLDEALKAGLQVILESSAADYAIMWYKDNTAKSLLHPYYWICPLDLSSISYAPGMGATGRAFAEQSPVTIINFQTAPDPVTANNLEGINVSSVCCVPFSNDTMQIGCIEFIKTVESGYFTEEDADMCQLLTVMTELAINESGLPPAEWKDKKAILSVRDIKKEFVNGEIITKVLKGVNFDVFEGEFLALLGESGCGKSTVLNIIGGMDKATSGHFSYMGRDMSDADTDELTRYRRENIGFVFQSYNLMPNLNAKQNLELIAELVDNPMDPLDALDLVHMRDKKDNYPSQLSGGQQQRISIARALIKKPRLILADEPTAALDYATSIEVLQAFEQVVAQGTTLIMVTHNEEITRMANRVLRFRNGKLYEVTVNHNPAPATDLIW
ncbi:MAG: ATP-binding cassette domain-containing protein [Lachnospiraceae bacterium]|nr:ATP-binding cassette domain-containing protein [Lachnospiraceae bacterium]